jgi:hypothetical protein
MQNKFIAIKPCKCGDFPRVRTNGGSYVRLFCRTCGYESGPFLNNTLQEVIQRWNESDRDREKQKAGVAAFDKMMEFCKEVKGTAAEDEPVPNRFFRFFQKGKE